MTSSAAYLVPALAVGVPVGIYALFLGLVSIPYIQRFAVYSHKINTLWWPPHNPNRPERWGFAKNQVTPFPLHTLDSQTLYAWHILPLGLYARHESALAAQDRSSNGGGYVPDITTTVNFRLLRDDPEARLVLYFHGNAGHITQSIRPRSFHALTSVSSKIHVLAIDYRGFGLSTGSPTEQGLILDARAAVDWATQVARIPPERIVLLGHSLGTAVAAAAAAEYCCSSEAGFEAGCCSSDDGTGTEPNRDDNHETRARREEEEEPMDFAGIILVAAFSSLPTMLSGYAIAGWIPVLRPLSFWPWLLDKVISRIVDKWPSAERLTRLTKSAKTAGRRLDLTLLHARDDWDIPCHEDDKLFRGAVRGLVEADLGVEDQHGTGEQEVEHGDERERIRMEEEREVENCVENLLEKEKGKRTVERWMGDVRKESERAFVTTWEDEGVCIRQELWPYGGHNNLMYYAPVPMAVMRAFGLVD
ncbi:alpha/beta-hydrolase [Neurospora crassa]|uniref:Abhydrolase domain containing 12 n=1 Tax=Neurospora crassa (strain ATCC 24698 / 74-OR23-1A / CBS 708.71 / DSM 1257 / FGSC 987) TaxID=367110 RepID=Q7S3C6_NEUCR|nr:abhydrolase domain containing 12 [Neurospora crassa OR74A]EAA30038.2 abhydrolase domain containing 12 [Neurospora crassa OR74A]KHE88053.1 alpha/beta-hydrolase [Neurospora crassa]|eukprot:XP_959274.2 abhydrolase domain containing 12 [Neurospora crassa OR74A]